MVRLRLKRMGTKQRPFYRIVAADSRSPQKGAFCEVLGTYSPLEGMDRATLHGDRVEHWLRSGARPTEIVDKILKKAMPQERKADSGS